MNHERPAPITKETAERRLNNFAGILESIFESEVIDEALNLICTIARQPIVLLSPDGYTCAFLNSDGTVGGNLTIAPNEPYEMSLTSAHKPGLDLIVAFQVAPGGESLAAAIIIIRDGKTVIQYFSGCPSEANPESILLEMFRNRRTAQN